MAWRIDGAPSFLHEDGRYADDGFMYTLCTCVPKVKALSCMHAEKNEIG